MSNDIHTQKWEDISDSDNEGGERKNDEKLEENKPDNQNKKDEIVDDNTQNENKTAGSPKKPFQQPFNNQPSQPFLNIC
jgi:hypothetical protein